MFDKTDLQLKKDIEAELLFDPKVNAAQIGVSVDKGAVTLGGSVDTYAEKWAAEDATKRVAGVRAVAEGLAVKLQGPHHHEDPEIAAAALGALRWNVWVPKIVTLRVHQGVLTLEGEVEWQFQRDAAENAVRFIEGVVDVTNAIRIHSRLTAEQVKEQVQAALQRQATADAKTIHVETSGGAVTLSGKASSWHVIEDAAHAAWAAPGVTSVVDNIHMSGF